MEKKKKLDVSNINLISFEGFYQTIWCPEFEISDYELENEVEEDKDFTFDNDGYEKAICEAYTQQWEQLLQQYICKDIKLSFVGVQHPLSYNYCTDTIQVKIGLTNEAKKAIMAKVKEHREKVGAWIEQGFTSYDGFFSNLSHYIEDWNRRTFFDHSEKYQESYLAYILYFLILAEVYKKDGSTSDSLEMQTYWNISEQMSITEFITYPGNNKAA
jgi:hypothetical protein